MVGENTFKQHDQKRIDFQIYNHLTQLNIKKQATQSKNEKKT